MQVYGLFAQRKANRDILIDLSFSLFLFFVQAMDAWRRGLTASSLRLSEV